MFQTHTKQHVKLWLCIFQSSSLWREEGKTKDSEQNGEKLFSKFICS